RRGVQSRSPAGAHLQGDCLLRTVPHHGRGGTMKLAPSRNLLGLGLWFALSSAGCDPSSPTPQGDSQTNWLKSCDADADCGALSCVCGVCTRACDGGASCDEGFECFAKSAPATVAACSGQAPPSSG